ncbi:hypothetical protein [Nonomuraea diastatica]|uniref:Uncharacterized protein n=1 Tax=Nonomuraea diastatica TaxID=1848329 RepID=A0A4R4WFZ4_9ACTN|nr:hypothetical protein [Nonomuraea diastatica]TDD17842.1 hypothetical protein E1294_26430 [Nonomuraea diastatica]
MSAGIRFDQKSLEAAGQHLQDVSTEFQQRTQALFVAVRGTGETAWGGSTAGMAMDGLTDLLEQACAHLHGNLRLTGEGITAMARDFRGSEHAAQEVVDAAGPGSTGTAGPAPGSTGTAGPEPGSTGTAGPEPGSTS